MATKAKSKAKPAAKPAAPAAKAVEASKRDYKELLNKRFRGDLMLGTLFAEMIGTGVLTAVVLINAGSGLAAALAVLVLVLVLGKLSSVHLNPAITLAMLSVRQITPVRAAGYIVAQFLGAMLGLAIVTQFVTSGDINPLTGQAPQVFTVDKLAADATWRPFFAETLGALVFGFGLAASVLTKKQGLDAGWAIGGSLFLGLIIASLAVQSVLNPAVALGLSAYSVENWWTIWVYALAPIVGAVLGAWLYKLLQWDGNGGKTQ